MNPNNYDDLVPVKAGLYLPLSRCHPGDSASNLMALMTVFTWYFLMLDVHPLHKPVELASMSQKLCSADKRTISFQAHDMYLIPSHKNQNMLQHQSRICQARTFPLRNMHVYPDF